MRGEQAIFNLEIKKKSGLGINPDIHHSKVFSSAQMTWIWKKKTWRVKGIIRFLNIFESLKPHSIYSAISVFDLHENNIFSSV